MYYCVEVPLTHAIRCEDCYLVMRSYSFTGYIFFVRHVCKSMLFAGDFNRPTKMYSIRGKHMLQYALLTIMLNGCVKTMLTCVTRKCVKHMFNYVTSKSVRVAIYV